MAHALCGNSTQSFWSPLDLCEGNCSSVEYEVSVLCALWSEVVVFGVYLKAAFKTQPKSSSDICHIVFEINTSLIDIKTPETKFLLNCMFELL